MTYFLNYALTHLGCKKHHKIHLRQATHAVLWVDDGHAAATEAEPELTVEDLESVPEEETRAPEAVADVPGAVNSHDADRIPQRGGAYPTVCANCSVMTQSLPMHFVCDKCHTFGMCEACCNEYPFVLKWHPKTADCRESTAKQAVARGVHVMSVRCPAGPSLHSSVNSATCGPICRPR